MLNGLGMQLYTRSRRLGALDDLDRAIQVTEKVLEFILPDDGTRAGCLSNLSAYLYERLFQLESLDDFHRSRHAAEKVAAGLSENNLVRTNVFNASGAISCNSAVLSGDVGYLV